MKKILLLLATVLTGVSAWAQNYDGIYTMQVDENQQRGYVVAGEGYADYPVLSDITLNGYQQNSVDAIENGKNWYITTVNDGTTYYFYNVAVGKFLVQDEKLSGVYVQFRVQLLVAIQFLLQGTQTLYALLQILQTCLCQTQAVSHALVLCAGYVCII